MKRSMDCERIEKLFPLYIDGEITPLELENISDHLSVCPACTRSLKTYRELENSLATMPYLLPDPGAVASRVSASLGLENRRNIAGIFRRLTITWAVAAVTASLVLVLSRFDLASFLVSEQESFISAAARSMEYWINTAGARIAGQLDVFSATDPWLLASGMIGFSFLIFAAGTMAAFKSIR